MSVFKCKHGQGTALGTGASGAWPTMGAALRAKVFVPHAQTGQACCHAVLLMPLVFNQTLECFGITASFGLLFGLVWHMPLNN